MGRWECFLIGLVAGALAAHAIHVAYQTPRSRPLLADPVVIRDTVRTACCDELLEHYAAEHGAGAR